MTQGQPPSNPQQPKQVQLRMEDVIGWFHQLYYRLGHEQRATWDKTYWMGVKTEKLPLDMWIYQEILHHVRPDFILETGTRNGGSALFLCQMMDLIEGADGACEVVTVDVTSPQAPPQHRRLTYLTGSSTDPKIVEDVRRRAAGKRSVLIVLDSDHRCYHVMNEMRAYHDLVTPGSYMIVEDSNVNGHPVWPQFGPGPMEAIKMFMQENQDFVIDKGAEKFLVTFNPNGFLRKKPKEQRVRERTGEAGGCGDGKSSVEEIRARFDKDVERFANLETGQSATIDAPLVLELIAQAAAATNPAAKRVLDVGCGAGNYTLKLIERLPSIGGVTLIDLSRPMLDRAVQRIATAAPNVAVTPVQGDVREIELGEEQFDVIVAAAVLHHLRDDGEWLAVFEKFQRALRSGGSIWISDLVSHSLPAVQAMMWRRYGEYLTTLRDARYRDEVFAYVQREDTPRPLDFQLDLLRRVGFRAVDVLHKNSCFAAFGAVK